MRFICYVLILLLSYLEGSGPDIPKPSPIVTEIHVSLTAEDRTIHRSYTRDEDIAQILDYLRYLDPYHKADIDPDTFRANHWEVVVCYADGHCNVYRQLHREYLQKDGGAWRRIDTEDDLLFLFS